MSIIFFGDGEMTVLGKEDRVGEIVSEEKFSCSSTPMHFPLSVITCYTRVDSAKVLDFKKTIILYEDKGAFGFVYAEVRKIKTNTHLSFAKSLSTVFLFS